jgi:hypothetical protein
MATFYLALAVAIVALGVIVVLPVLWWRRRASARHTAVADTAPSAPEHATVEDSEDVTLTAPDEIALAAPNEAGAALPDDMRFAPPDEPAVATPDDASPAAVVAESAIDPSRPTKVTFHLQLPTQGHARSAGQIARREGYTADVQPPREGATSWFCLLTREMSAAPEEIETERAYLAELAEGFGGQLDRWEAEARR